MRTRSRTRALQGDVQHYHLDAKSKPVAVGALGQDVENLESAKVGKISTLKSLFLNFVDNLILVMGESSSPRSRKNPSICCWRTGR